MTAEYKVINKQLATKANVTITHASHTSQINLIILAYPSKCHATRRQFYGCHKSVQTVPTRMAWAPAPLVPAKQTTPTQSGAGVPKGRQAPPNYHRRRVDIMGYING